jgi:hypothetical protein
VRWARLARGWRNTGTHVGDRFDPGQCGAAGGEGLQDQDHADGLADPGGLRGADHRRRVRAHQADGDDTEERGQEHRYRQHEGTRAFRDSPQVDRSNHGQAGQHIARR